MACSSPCLFIDSGSLTTDMSPQRITGVRQMAGASVPRTKEEWDSHRTVITRLYSEQDLPLREVQRIMESQYKFKATYVLERPFF